MRLASSNASWLAPAFAFLLATGCKIHHEWDGSMEPSPSGRGPGAPRDAGLSAPSELAIPADSCLGYRLQRAAPAALPRQVPNVALGIVAQEGREPRLSVGPLLGAISDRSVKVWVRADRPAAWTVRVWPKEDASSPLLDAQGQQLTAANDFAGSVHITGLEPEQDYGYSVVLRSGFATSFTDEPAAPIAQGVFRTLAPEHAPARTRIVFGADITGSGPQRIFRQIQELHPSFLLLLGDQIYADAAEPTREGYAQFYRRNWNIKYLRAMFRQVPTFMIWDDHDIQDNYWQGKSERYAPAREAYELYVQSHNPQPYRSGMLYYTLRSGDVALFVLDVRSHRSPNRAIDDSTKTMLGTEQKRDLLDWLRCEPARLKLIVSPVIWNDWAMTGQDPWRSFSTEREELLEFVARENVGDVMLLSGDQHWSAVFRFQRENYTFYEFLPTPLSKTRGTAPAERTDEIIARDDDNYVFGVVDIDTTVDPTSIALTLCAADKPCRPGEEPEPGTDLDPDGDAENVPFTIRLTSRDLGLPKGDAPK